MSVTVPIIIISCEAAFPLLFLIGREDSAIPKFYSKEIFFCLFCIYLEGKNQQPTQTNPETKHVTGGILYSFNLRGARSEVQGQVVAFVGFASGLHFLCCCFSF